MKKAIKKLMAALLAVAMLCAMAVPAFADGSTPAGTTYTITINNPVGTYKAYQIFSGDLEGKILSNIVWGTGVTEAGKTDLGSAKERADTLTNEPSVKAFAKEVSKYLGESSGSYSDGKISGLAAGYYLIKKPTPALFWQLLMMLRLSRRVISPLWKRKSRMPTTLTALPPAGRTALTMTSAMMFLSS